MSSIKSFSEKYTKVIALKDGKEALLRPIRSTDDQMMYDFLNSCSYDTLFFRFMSSAIYIHLQKGNKEAIMKRIKNFTDIDHENHISIVAIMNDEKMVSEGLFVKTAPDRADVAVMTADDWQRKGLARKIGDFMMEIAKEKGIKFFEGEILLSNYALLNLFKTLKVKYTRVIRHGVLHFSINVDEPYYE